MATGTISWSPATGAVNYTVEWKKSSDMTWTTWTGSPTTLTIATIAGLNEGTSYDFRITNNCTSGSTIGAVFTTDSPCTDTTFVSTTPVGLTIVVVWNRIVPAVSSYVIDWKLHSSGSYGSPVTVADPGSGSTVTYTITTGLSYGNAYDVRVKVNCFSLVNPQSTGIVDASVAISCPAPTGTSLVWS